MVQMFIVFEEVYFFFYGVDMNQIFFVLTLINNFNKSERTL